MKNILLFFALIAAVAAPAQEAAIPERPRPLQAGDVAPALQFAEWVKGSPITVFEAGRVYLVEFWAVWCGPCIANIPHLNALQKKYRNDGLVVVGFTSPDRTPDKPDRKEGNSLESVLDFVKRRGDAMDYHVAYDLPDRSTFKSYFNASQAGIPHAFIVGRDGKIVASGHPYFLDEIIRDVMADRWDPVKGPEQHAELKRLLGMNLGAEGKGYAAFKQLRAELKTFSPLYYERSIFLEMIQALENDDRAEVLSVGEIVMRKAIETGETGDLEYMLNQMLRRDPIKTKAQPFLELAGRMSEAFLTASKGRDSSALSLRAEWFACMGNLQSAVEFQRKAVEVEVESRSAGLKARLADLEKALAATTG